MNIRRVLVGGIVAGILNLGLGFVLGHLVLKESTERLLREHPPPEWAPIAISTTHILLGFVFVFTYVMMRPRLGPGPKTALIAGLVLWAVSYVPYALMFGLTGRLTPGEASIMVAWGAAANVLCTMVGAALYREPAVTPAAR